VKDKLEQIKHSAVNSIDKAETLSEIEELRIQYLGKKGELTALLRQMKDLTPEERPVVGQLVNVVREEIENKLITKKELLEAARQNEKLKEEIIDITMPGKKPVLGHIHPLTQTLEEIQRIFLGMGYEIVDGTHKPHPLVHLQYHLH
jgi:phenylalanyl-tRNA synthetase alpha chain